MRGTIIILHDGDPLPETLKDAIAVACAEALAKVLVRFGYAPDSLLVQG